MSRPGLTEPSGKGLSLGVRAELTRSLANHVPPADQVALHHVAVLKLSFLILKMGLTMPNPRAVRQIT